MEEEWRDGGTALALATVEPRAALAERLATLGGRIALDHFDGAEISGASGGWIVTDVDAEIRDTLAQEIRAAFPEDAVLEEDALDTNRVADEERYLWVLDPLDGTNDFGRGLPGFSVSVGVLQAGVPVAGAVYDPLVGWLFAAADGEGARLNGRRFRCEPQPLSPQSLFALRTPYEAGVPRFAVRWLRQYRLRRLGSTALHLCYVALGGLAFVHDQRAALPDLAGAACVLREAGGVLTRADGTPLFPVGAAEMGEFPLSILAGNSQAHRGALAEITR